MKGHPGRKLVSERGVEAFRRAWRAHPLMRLQSKEVSTRAQVDRVLERYPVRDLPGAGDLPNLDITVAYNEAIQAFLRQQSRAAA